MLGLVVSSEIRESGLLVNTVKCELLWRLPLTTANLLNEFLILGLEAQKQFLKSKLRVIKRNVIKIQNQSH